MEVLKHLALSSGSRYGLEGLNSPYIQRTSVSLMSGSVWSIIAAVLAVVGALVAFFFFARQPRDKFTGFAAKLHDFVNFKRLRAEAILKLFYLAVAIFTTLASFELISTSFLLFFLTLVIGNIMLWVTFQFAMIMVKIYRNLEEINAKLSKKK